MRPPSSWKTPRVSPAGQQLVGLGVVERQVEQLDAVAGVELDHLEAVVDDRQVAQAQEVHLQQAERLAGRVVELRDDRAVGVAAHDRDVVGDHLGRHDHAGGVDAGLPDQALQAAPEVDGRLDVDVFFVEFAQLTGLVVARVVAVEDAGERDVLAHDGGRERLGDLVAEGVGVAQDAAGVLDGRFRLDRAEGGDHGDLVGAPLLGDVADHVAAPALVEVDVDVGHGDALGVEEPLEVEAVRDRVEVGDAHRVGDQRARRRTTAGADPDAVVLGPHDEVGDHEEVAREAHLDDDVAVSFSTQARCSSSTPPGKRRCMPFHTSWRKNSSSVIPSGIGEGRHQVLVLEEAGGVDLLGDQQGVRAAFLPQVGGVDGAHLVGGLDVVAAAVEPEPAGVGELLAGLDAQQGVVGLGVGLVGVVRVVGDDRRDVQLFAEMRVSPSRTRRSMSRPWSMISRK